MELSLTRIAIQRPSGGAHEPMIRTIGGIADAQLHGFPILGEIPHVPSILLL